MNRNVKFLRTKSISHDVTRLDNDKFEVVSGASGNKYYVELQTVGASCTCNWSAKRHNILSCGCSHVVAVFSYLEKEKSRRTYVHNNPETAFSQHRPINSIGDGLILTSRKVN